MQRNGRPLPQSIVYSLEYLHKNGNSFVVAAVVVVVIIIIIVIVVVVVVLLLLLWWWWWWWLLLMAIRLCLLTRSVPVSNISVNDGNDRRMTLSNEQL